MIVIKKISRELSGFAIDSKINQLLFFATSYPFLLAISGK